MASGTENGASAPRNLPKPDDYLPWPELPAGAGGPLNRYSHAITREHDFPAAKVSLPTACCVSLWM